MARMIDGRRALLVAALAAARVTSREPALLVVRAWLDSWRGIGSIVVGMARHGYVLSLTSDRDGWRATFLHRSHLMQPWIGQVLTWCATPWPAVQEAARGGRLTSSPWRTARSSTSHHSSVIELYQVPPSAFGRERSARAARRRTAGRTAEAADVARLRRPTPVLWAINRVAHDQPGEVKQLIEATDALKLVQLGRRKDVDAVGPRRRRALQTLVTRAGAALRSVALGGSPAMLRRASATLLGAAADSRARALLQQGRLSEELSAPGFEVFGGMTPRTRPVAPAARPRPATRSKQAGPTESSTDKRAAERDARLARQRLQTLEREARRRRRRAERTGTAAAALRRRLHEIDERLAQERRQADEAERDAAKAREANRGR